MDWMRTPIATETKLGDVDLQCVPGGAQLHAELPEPRNFSGATIMITGGTGSFGSTILKHFLALSVAEVRVVSRDEKKQDEQRRRFADGRIRHYVGDVRDFRAMEGICRDVDFIYHAAALKQVPSCEFHPIEAVNTNVTGTQNVLDAAIRAGVQRVVCLSTDKAVYPINAMGMSKALMEKVMVAKSREASGKRTVITGTRYGNVLASRGSVVPLFMDQVRRGQPITITDPNMTRFVMTLDEAVELCLDAFQFGGNGEILVRKVPAVTIEKLAQAVLEVMGRPDHPIRIIGPRHGEKHFETLLSREEMAVAQDRETYFCVPPDNRNLNYDVHFRSGKPSAARLDDFNSLNARLMDVSEMAAMLRNLPYVQAFLAGGEPDAF
ncbi:polysaccharide biosynthesis protein [Gluconacetobacter asukensis]